MNKAIMAEMIMGKRIVHLLSQKCHKMVETFLILLLILSLNFVGESTHPFFSRAGTSYALNILPSGAFRRWYIVMGAFFSSSILYGRYPSTYGTSSLLYLPCSKLSFISLLLEFTRRIVKASSSISFIFLTHNEKITRRANECGFLH